MAEESNQPFQLSFRPSWSKWSPTSLEQRLVKTGGRPIKDAWNSWLLLAEGHLTRRLFAAMVRRMEPLPAPAGGPGPGRSKPDSGPR